MAPTVLITGGTGYIALEIGHQLLSAGKYRVRASVRSLANPARNKPLLNLVADPKQGPPELVEANLLSAEGWYGGNSPQCAPLSARYYLGVQASTHP